MARRRACRRRYVRGVLRRTSHTAWIEQSFATAMPTPGPNAGSTTPSAGHRRCTPAGGRPDALFGINVGVATVVGWIRTSRGRVREWLGRLTPRSIVAFSAADSRLRARPSIRALAMAVARAAPRRTTKSFRRSGVFLFERGAGARGQALERWLRRAPRRAPAHRNLARKTPARRFTPKRLCDSWMRMNEARLAEPKSVAASSRVEGTLPELF